MAQHLWEISAGALGAAIAGHGLIGLISGRMIPLGGALAVLLGAGIGIAALTLDAERPGVRHGNGWGGTAGAVTLSVWGVLLGAAVASKLLRARPRDGDDEHR